MQKLSVSEIIARFVQTIRRFTFTVFFVLGLSVLFVISINFKQVDIAERLWVFFYLGVSLSVMIAMFAENFKNKLVQIGLQLLALIALVLHTLFLPEKLQAVDIYQTVVLVFSGMMISFIASYLKKEDGAPFWEFSKTVVVQLIFASVFSLVLMLGLSLAVLSLDELFKINVHEEVYQNLGVFCFALFAPFYFLANVPVGENKYKQEMKFDKFLKILGQYILLPILAIYTVILYVYLIQIVIQWQLPNGWVTWLVSVLALVGFITMMILYPLRISGNKLTVFFSEYFPVILLPLIVLMTVGIFRRYGDYGLTINRGYVFLLNFWLYAISIYLFFSHSRNLKWIILTFVAVAVVSSVGPWSIYQMTKNTMLERVDSLLTNNHFLLKGKLLSNKELKLLKITSKTNDELSAKVDYLVDNYGTDIIQNYFIEDIHKLNRFEILERMNLKRNKTLYSSRKFYNANLESATFKADISGYSGMLSLDLDQNKLTYTDTVCQVDLNIGYLICRFKNTGLLIKIPIRNKLDELMVFENYKEYPLKELTILGTDYLLLIQSVNLQKDDENNLKITGFKGLLFYK